MNKVFICALVLLLGLTITPALAQRYAVDVDGADPLDFETELTIGIGEPFCFDVYLTDATLGNNPGAGGVWIEFNGSGSLVSYVSATDAVPPWTAGPTVNEPYGAGTFFTKVQNLSSVDVPDGSNNILITTMCYDCLGAGDVAFTLCAGAACDTSGSSYWPSPYDDATINANTPSPLLTVYQGGPCTQDSDCDDLDFCNGVETCDIGGTDLCIPGTPIECDDGVGCTSFPKIKIPTFSDYLSEIK